MNILVVHEIDFKRRVVFDYQSLGEMLALRGHKVYVIDYESLWKKDSILDFGSLQPKESKVQRIYAPITLYDTGFIKIPIISRITAVLTSYSLIEKFLKEKKIDVVILYSVPTNGLQTVYLAHKYHIPVIFRSMDVLNQLVPESLSWIVKTLERVVYSHVDLTLAVNNKMAKYVVSMGGKNVDVLLMGVDKQFQPNIDTTSLRFKLGLKDKKVILFVGTLYLFSGLGKVIEDFHRVLKELPEARLLIVGDGAARLQLETLIKGFHLENEVILTGQQRYETIPEYINLADVCINSLEICEATKNVSPIKVLQYLACGKPVVSTKLLGLEGYEGVLFTDSIVDGIIEVLNNKTNLGKVGLEYSKNYDYEKIIDQLESILNGMRKC